MGVKFRLIAVLALIASLFATTLTASAQDVPPYNPHAYEFATDEFEGVWERTDLPVQQGVTERTWMWGPGANTPLIQEPYVEAGENQLRDVQYTDKSRMEMPWNSADPDSPWFITQGLLAYEMMTGKVQVGDAEFVEAFPAGIQVAGDPGSPGPTYATMGSAMDNDPRSEGNVIVDVITADGFIFQNEALGPAYGVTDDYWIQETGFYVASVFWDFMQSTGTIWDGEGYVDNQPVVPNPFYAVGFPTTPAYWAWVEVNSVEQNVLVQCFERRCLTYTPNNAPEWQVESGNVGQHYFEWRYNQVGDVQIPDPDPAEANSFTVTPGAATNAVGDTHDITVTVLDQNGEPFAGAGVSASVTDTTTANDAHLGVELTPDDASSGADGTATLSYTGIEEGTDTITVEVDGIEGSQTVTKTWAEYSLNLDPEESTNPLGVQHSIEITVVDSDDEQVDIAAAGDVTAEISRVFDDAADDDEPVNVGASSVEVDDGIATLSYDGPDEPAQDTIEITVMVEGVSVTGTATKTWAGPELVLDPEDAENAVGSEYTLTATLMSPVEAIELDDEDDFDVSISREINDDSADFDDFDTEINDDGQIEVTYTGPDAAAVDTITVSVEHNDSTVTATTTKTWSDYVLTVTPETGVNLLGDEHELRASLSDFEGTDVDIDDVNNVSVDIERTFDDESTGSLDTDDVNVTLDDGDAVITYTNDAAAAVDQITVTVSVNGSSASSEASKTWIDVQISIDPDDATNPYLNDEQLANAYADIITQLNLGSIGTFDQTLTFLSGLADLDLETIEAGLDDAGSVTEPDIEAIMEALGASGLNNHTFNVSVTVNGDPAEGNVDVLVEDDDSTLLDENLALTDGDVSVTYWASGVLGTDSITVTYESDGGAVSETASKTWVLNPVSLEITAQDQQLQEDWGPDNVTMAYRSIEAQLVDEFGNPVQLAGVEVNFERTDHDSAGGAGEFAGIDPDEQLGTETSATTDANGVATVLYGVLSTNPNLPIEITIEAEFDGMPDPVEYKFTFLGTPVSLEITAQDQQLQEDWGPDNVTMAYRSIEAQLVDESGNPVQLAGVEVNFERTAHDSAGGAGEFAGIDPDEQLGTETSATTDANGVATVIYAVFAANPNLPIEITIEAEFDGMPDPVEYKFTLS